MLGRFISLAAVCLLPCLGVIHAAANEPDAPGEKPSRQELLESWTREQEAKTQLVSRFSAPITFKEAEHDVETIDAGRLSLSRVVRIQFHELVGDEELRLVGAFPSLESLSLKGDFTDAGLQHLSSLRHLERLSLYSPYITDRGFSHIQGPKLRTLDLHYAPIGDLSLRHIGTFSRLEVLHLTACRKVTDEGVKELVRLKDLKVLWLPGTSITDGAIDPILHLSELVTLGLGGTKVTQESLVKLATLRKLKVLNFDGIRVTAAALDAFKRALPETMVLGASP